LAALVAAGVEDAPHWAAMIQDEVAALPAEEQGPRANSLIRMCLDGTPPAYVLGKQKFMGLTLMVARGVVFPRPVTERVARAGLRVMVDLHRQRPGRPLRLVDMCSGSGNLACAIAFHDPTCQVWSCDLMPAASDLARQNVARLGLENRVAIRTGDLFGALACDELEGALDVVVCAPPFISTGRLAKDRASLLRHEPREAFDAGPYGLGIHQRVSVEAASFLRPGGFLVLEVGEGQSKQVSMLLARTRAYDEIVALDENGDEKNFVVRCRRKGAESSPSGNPLREPGQTTSRTG
jgi:release factor glutamine methyltransferase